MEHFNFADPAELYARAQRGRHVSYFRFDTAAEAIRYAMEELPTDLRFGLVVEVDEVRLGPSEIAELYESEGYPLSRRQ